MARTSLEPMTLPRGFRRSNGTATTSRHRKNTSGFFAFLRGRQQSPRRPSESPRTHSPILRANIPEEHTPVAKVRVIDPYQHEDRRTSLVTVIMRRRASTVSAKSGHVEDLLDMASDSVKTPRYPPTSSTDSTPQSCPVSPGSCSAKIQTRQDNTFARIPSTASTTASRGAIHSLVRRMSSHYIPAANLPSGHPAFDDPEPIFEFKRFGKRWAADVFVIFHNAARRELRDLQRAISAMKLKLNNGCLQLQDFADFFVWFAHLRSFMSETFVVHETLIFPWLESVIPMEGPLTKESRTKSQSAIMKHVLDIEKLRKLDHEKVAVDSLMSVAELTEYLFDETSRYFEILEDKCPGLVEMFFSPESTREVELEIRNKLMKGKDAQVVFPILVHWMEPQDRNEWIISNMKGGRKLMMFYWQKNFDRTHGAVLERVCRTEAV